MIATYPPHNNLDSQQHELQQEMQSSSVTFDHLAQGDSSLATVASMLGIQPEQLAAAAANANAGMQNQEHSRDLMDQHHHQQQQQQQQAANFAQGLLPGMSFFSSLHNPSTGSSFVPTTTAGALLGMDPNHAMAGMVDVPVSSSVMAGLQLLMGGSGNPGQLVSSPSLNPCHASPLALPADSLLASTPFQHPISTTGTMTNIPGSGLFILPPLIQDMEGSDSFSSSFDVLASPITPVNPSFFNAHGAVNQAFFAGSPLINPSAASTPTSLTFPPLPPQQLLGTSSLVASPVGSPAPAPTTLLPIASASPPTINSQANAPSPSIRASPLRNSTTAPATDAPLHTTARVLPTGAVSPLTRVRAMPGSSTAKHRAAARVAVAAAAATGGPVSAPGRLTRSASTSASPTMTPLAGGGHGMPTHYHQQQQQQQQQAHGIPPSATPPPSNCSSTSPPFAPLHMAGSVPAVAVEPAGDQPQREMQQQQQGVAGLLAAPTGDVQGPVSPDASPLQRPGGVAPSDPRGMTGPPPQAPRSSLVTPAASASPGLPATAAGVQASPSGKATAAEASLPTPGRPPMPQPPGGPRGNGILPSPPFFPPGASASPMGKPVLPGAMMGNRGGGAFQPPMPFQKPTPPPSFAQHGMPPPLAMVSPAMSPMVRPPGPMRVASTGPPPPNGVPLPLPMPPTGSSMSPMAPLRHRAVLATAAAEARNGPGAGSSDGGSKTPYSLSHHRISDQRRREELKVCFDNLLVVLPPPAPSVGVRPTGWRDEEGAGEGSQQGDEDDEEGAGSKKKRESEECCSSSSGDDKAAPAKKQRTMSGSSSSASKPPNRVEIMGRTLEYIIGLKKRMSTLDGTIDGLRKELERLKVAKGIMPPRPAAGEAVALGGQGAACKMDAGEEKTLAPVPAPQPVFSGGQWRVVPAGNAGMAQPPSHPPPMPQAPSHLMSMMMADQVALYGGYGADGGGWTAQGPSLQMQQWMQPQVQQGGGGRRG
ncbi:hypothetical protein HDU96_000145 [Phlyctochytrium bullatum]|nr:hypothetical protein HDU96_000145 [Phlyctochytrium bullatum]